MTDQTKLKVHTGKYFPKPLNLIGYFSLIFGIIKLIESPLLGIPIIIAGSYLSFNLAGFEIANGRFRSFFYLLNFKIGKWKTSDLPNIAILKRKFARRTYGGRTPVSITEKEFVYELTLLSETKETRLKLLRVNDIEKAKDLEDRIAILLDVTKID